MPRESTSGSIWSALGEAYENFIMRDLTYAFAGLIIFFGIKYTIDGEILSWLKYIASDIIRILFFLLSAYFTGLIVKEGLTYSNVDKQDTNVIHRDLKWAFKYNRLSWRYWFSTDHLTPSDYKGFYVFMSEVEKIFGYSTLRRLERTAFFFHCGAAFGTASFISLGFTSFGYLGRFILENQIVYSNEFFLFFIALIGLIIWSLWYNHKKLNEYNYHIQYLAENMKNYEFSLGYC